jgi:hypothetical protein
MAAENRHIDDLLKEISCSVPPQIDPTVSPESCLLRSLLGQLEMYTEISDYRIELGDRTKFDRTLEAELLTLNAPARMPIDKTDPTVRSKRLASWYGLNISSPLRRLIDTLDPEYTNTGTSLNHADMDNFRREKSDYVTIDQAEIQFQKDIRRDANKAIIAILRNGSPSGDLLHNADYFAHAIMTHARVNSNLYTCQAVRYMNALYDSEKVVYAGAKARLVVHMGRIVAGLPII